MAVDSELTKLRSRNATTFAISRRRMVVPIHKRWEAIRARLQVLKQDKIVQLAAFFEDFNHGDCMNFALKSTDVFESFNRSGKFCIRIVDAKFALPKEGEGARRKFVCLDRPDYPGEHDDIAIAFDTEAGALQICTQIASAARLTYLTQSGISLQKPSQRQSTKSQEWDHYENERLRHYSYRRLGRFVIRTAGGRHCVSGPKASWTACRDTLGVYAISVIYLEVA